LEPCRQSRLECLKDMYKILIVPPEALDASQQILKSDSCGLQMSPKGRPQTSGRYNAW
jgi:hypothetical protein